LAAAFGMAMPLRSHFPTPLSRNRDSTLGHARYTARTPPPPHRRSTATTAPFDNSYSPHSKASASGDAHLVRAAPRTGERSLPR
jgi:hypothetical protein